MEVVSKEERKEYENGKEESERERGRAGVVQHRITMERAIMGS